ncbi:MAG: hypothetical protein MUF21_05425 [Gemmatimonadaceae bacterium]|nr:hypothetical protein [Gemmatimonadaceae bacterium]
MRDPTVPRVRAPDFPTDLAWVNVAGAPPTLAALRGRVVLLDVWTAGCINCRHLVPTLHAIERRYGDAIAILGIHSGKYPAERDPAFIAHACARLGITHPVLDDRRFRTWRAFAVRAWPTLVVIDHLGFVVAMHAGECTIEEIAPYLDLLVHASGHPITPHVPGASPTASAAAALRFPGAVALHPRDPARIAIADAGHARILVGTFAADAASCVITAVHGDGVSGYRDGDAPRWGDPQGLAWRDDDTLLVADTGAHALRALDTRTGRARTLAGTGVRVRTDADRAAGAMASPWGLAVAGDTCWIAMAGTHQLWRHDGASGRTHVAAGTGGEALVDGPALAALLAQPTALAVEGDGPRCWIACAEGNAIREFDRDAGTVRTLVGTGLFDFGHIDGVGDEVRLQHPQGVAWDAARGRLLIADSYNGALRALDPGTRRVTTLARELGTPVGVAVCPGGAAVVVDERGHRLLVVDAASGAVRTVTVEFAGGGATAAGMGRRA